MITESIKEHWFEADGKRRRFRIPISTYGDLTASCSDEDDQKVW